MSIEDKDFRVKNGLQVTGTASFNSDIIIDSVRIAYDSNYKRLKAYINDEWHMLALDTDVIDSSQPLDGGNPNSVYSSVATIDGGTI